MSRPPLESRLPLYAGIEQEFGHVLKRDGEVLNYKNYAYGNSLLILADSNDFPTGDKYKRVVPYLFNIAGVDLGVEPEYIFDELGGRPYLDHDKFEYGAVEAKSIREAVAGHLAGHIIAGNLSGIYDVSGVGKLGITFDTTVIDFRDVSYGVHYNYFMRRNIPNMTTEEMYFAQATMRALNMFFGAGYVTEEGEVERSQRIRVVKPDSKNFVGLETTLETRALVNNRDDHDLYGPEAMRDYRRLHTINYDGLMIPAGIAFQMAYQKVFIRALEQGVDLSNFIFEDPVAVAHLVGRDSPYNNTEIPDANGGETRVADQLIALGEYLIAHTIITEEERFLIQRAMSTLRTFKDNPIATKDSLDAVGKNVLVDQFKKQKKNSSVNALRTAIHYGWHRLDRNENDEELNLVYKGRAKGHFNDDPTGSLRLARFMYDKFYLVNGRGGERARYRRLMRNMDPSVTVSDLGWFMAKETVLDKEGNPQSRFRHFAF